jgi:hypothetical protein
VPPLKGSRNLLAGEPSQYYASRTLSLYLNYCDEDRDHIRQEGVTQVNFQTSEFLSEQNHCLRCVLVIPVPHPSWRAIAKRMGVGVGTLYRAVPGRSKIREEVFGT